MFPIIRLEPFEVTLSDDDQQKSSLTVYPLTVEFDRLLRRQQQLEGNTCQKYCSSKSNSVCSSISLDLSSNVIELCSPLQKVNASELLFATVIHYYANLNRHVEKELLFSSTNSGSLKSHKQNFSMDEIFRSISSPGTRTTLLVIDKLDTIKLFEEQLRQSDLQNLTDYTTPSQNSHHSFQQVKRREKASLASSQQQQQQSQQIQTNRIGESIKKSSISNQSVSGTLPNGHNAHIQNAWRSRQIASIIFDNFRQCVMSTMKNENSDYDNNLTKCQYIESQSRSPGQQKSQFHKHSCDLDDYLNRALDRKQTLIDVLQCCLFQEHCSYNSSHDKQENVTAHQSQLFLVGVEQQIIGAITFYKSYRLTGTKIIEAPFISIHSNFRRLGIGSRLLTSLKNCGQIGPYDAIRVRIDSSRNDIRRFFLSNEFSDDLILNASFDQLHSVYSNTDEDVQGHDCDYDDDIDDDDDDDSVINNDSNHKNDVGQVNNDDDNNNNNDNDDAINDELTYSDNNTDKMLKDTYFNRQYSRESFTNSSGECSLRVKTDIVHSASLGSFQRPSFYQQDRRRCNNPSHTKHSNHHHFRNCHYLNFQQNQNQNSLIERGCNDFSAKLISLCYLPPFALSTSIIKTASNETVSNVQSKVSMNVSKSNESSCLLNSLDNYRVESKVMLDEIEYRQVDDMIEDAHRLWRRELLSAYRTQWSCVARLRAEIVRLREKVHQCEETIGSLKKDNHQLRTSLLQSESKINSQKHLFLLKNFNFDTMDF